MLLPACIGDAGPCSAAAWTAVRCLIQAGSHLSLGPASSWQAVASAERQLLTAIVRSGVRVGLHDSQSDTGEA